MDLFMRPLTGVTLSCHLIDLVSFAVHAIFHVRADLRRPRQDACWIRLLTLYALSRVLVDNAVAVETVLMEGMRRRVLRVMGRLVLRLACIASPADSVEFACIANMALLFIMAAAGSGTEALAVHNRLRPGMLTVLQGPLCDEVVRPTARKWRVRKEVKYSKPESRS